MSGSTISTFKLLEMFPDEETARTYLEGRLWPSGPICPRCKSGERITARTRGRVQTLQCVPVRFHGSHRYGLWPFSCTPSQVDLRYVSARDGTQGHFLDPIVEGTRHHSKISVVRPSQAP